MADSNRSRRQYLAIEAIDPKDGKPCEVMISYDRMQAVSSRSTGQIMECSDIVPMILQHPTAIFEGLRWDQDEDQDRRGVGWRCYCGIPDHAYRMDGTPIPPYRGQVYLVFVNDERVAYNWRWEKASPDDPRRPVDHETRFREQLL